MKKILIGLVLACIATTMVLSKETSVTSATAEQASIVQDPLTHEQRVWLGALEWCESRGITTAVNPNDKDNTPSYYSFQFKPGTWRGYGEKYGVVETGLTDTQIMSAMQNYETTYKIMEHMILDESISAKQWREQLFPGCTRKLGVPPVIPNKSIDKKPQA